MSQKPQVTVAAKGKGWRDEEKAALRRLFEEGLGDAKIAEHLPDKKTWQVKKRRAQDGLRKYRPWTPEETAKGRQLRAEGRMWKEVADALGRTVSSTKWGLTRPNPEEGPQTLTLPPGARPVTDPYEIMGLPGGLRAERTGPGRYELGVALRLDGRPVRDE